MNQYMLKILVIIIHHMNLLMMIISSYIKKLKVDHSFLTNMYKNGKMNGCLTAFELPKDEVFNVLRIVTDD